MLKAKKPFNPLSAAARGGMSMPGLTERQAREYTPTKNPTGGRIPKFTKLKIKLQGGKI